LNKEISPTLVVLCVASFFLLANLSLSPVFQVSEGHILPLRHKEIVPSKPVLFHQLSVLPYKIFGADNPFSLRLVSALAAIATCMLMFSLASVIAGRDAGLFAVGFLLSTYGFIHLARDGRVDMLFNFFVFSAVFVWFKAACEAHAMRLSPREISNLSYFLFAVFTGLAILVKGPLGLVLPFAIILGISILEWGFEGFLSCIRVVLIFSILIPIPWYLLATLEGGSDFLIKQIIFENLARFTGGEGVNTKPFWFYFEHFWTHLAPWSFLFFVLLYFPSKSESNTTRRFAMRSCLVWIFIIFSFLTISSGKRRAYLLPLIPAVALYLGLWCERWYCSFSKTRCENNYAGRANLYFLWTLVFIVLCSLLFIACSLAGFLPFNFSNPIDVTQIQATFEATKELFQNSSHSYQSFAKIINEKVADSDSLTFIKRKNDESFDALFFYMNRHVSLFDGKKLPSSSNKYYLLRKSNFLSMEGVKKAQILLEGGRLVDEKEEKLLLLYVP